MPNHNPANYDFIQTNDNRVQWTTGCAGAILEYFGCMGVTYNTRTQKNVWENTLRRNGYSVRSRMSKIGKGKRAGGIRKKLAEIANNEPNILAFVVRVKQHVLLVDRQGNTIVDTDPRQRDRRPVLGLVAIMRK
jgi:hypothetical protein